MAVLLEANDLHAGYGALTVLHGIEADLQAAMPSAFIARERQNVEIGAMAAVERPRVLARIA